MRMKSNMPSLSILFWCLFSLLVTCCTPVDYYYSEFLDNAERTYPGRVDSIEFRPGYNRAGIRALMSTDARVSKIRVVWGANETYETDVLSDEIARYKEVTIPGITEGSYTFEVYTYDNQGHQSMRSEVFGRVYGSQYERNLNNRIIEVITNDNEDEFVIQWFPEQIDTTLLGTLVTYPLLHGDSASIFTPKDANITVLKDVKPEGNFTFTTVYRPTPSAIDSFYASRVDVNPLDYIEPEAEIYPREAWSILDYSSQNNNSNHGISNILDNNSATFWIARFSGGVVTDYPNHYVTIDMGNELKVDGFMFAQKNGDRKIRELEILISSDSQDWESLGLFGLADIDREYQYLNLLESHIFRYFKIVPKSGHDTQKAPGLAEVGTFRYVY